MEVQQINQLFYEYISDSINLVLYHTSCYPKESFQLRRSFNLKIPINRHPQIVQYIDEFINKLNSSTGYLSKIRLVQLCVLEELTDHVQLIYEIDLSGFIYGKFKDDKLVIKNIDDRDVFSGFKNNLIQLMDKLSSTTIQDMMNQCNGKPHFKLFVKLNDDQEAIDDDDMFTYNMAMDGKNAFDQKRYTLVPLYDLDLEFLKIASVLKLR